ncbi:MAG: VanZ family protein [Bacilli bacterium]
MDKKITKLTIINIIIFALGIILYAVLTFFIKVNVGSGEYKELENVIIVAIPCFLIFIYSFMVDNPNKRRNCLIFYLVSYVVIMFGFVFSNYRSNILIEHGIMFREYNLIPFHSIINLFQSQLGQKFAIYNIAGNFFMLTPLAILLPMISKKFKKTKFFLPVIIILCLFIEIAQYITGLGSFDIDDIILNLSGAFILFLIITKTNISIFIENLFLKQQISRKFSFTIYILLLFIFLMSFVKRSLLIYNYYIDHRIDMSNVVCTANSKTYLGDIGNYSYYSECNYGNSFILVGKQKYQIKEFIKSQNFDDSLFENLNLERELIITNAILDGKKDRQKIRLFQNDCSSVYLYGYANLLIEKKGIQYDVKTELVNKNIDISTIHSLTKLKFVDNKNGYSVETGKYFNIVTCGENYAHHNEFYILEPKFMITKDTCSMLSSLSFLE